MGNAESQQQGHHSRRQTPTIEHERKRRSLSPSQLGTSRSDSLQNRTHSALSNTQNSSSSFHSTTHSHNQHQAAKKRIQQRRAKSFRVPRAGGSFRITVCSISGMTENQKQLVQQKWLELDKAGIFEFGAKIFQTVFTRDKRFLQVVGLSHLVDRKPSTIRAQLNFRVHVQRFCECLNSVIRMFDEPQKSISLLHEFGAFHLSTYEKENAIKAQKLPAAYWETLIFAINSSAKDLQLVESSRGSESPRNTFDKRFLLPGDDLSLSTPSASPSPTPFSLGPSTPRRYNSVCPTAAEAWAVFANYIVGQIRFGFEMERLLQAQLRRLVANSLQFSWQVPSSDENTTFSSRDDGTLDGLSIQTNTTALHGGGSISSNSNSSNSSSGSSAHVYTTDLPSIELIQHNGTMTMAALVE